MNMMNNYQQNSTTTLPNAGITRQQEQQKLQKSVYLTNSTTTVAKPATAVAAASLDATTSVNHQQQQQQSQLSSSSKNNINIGKSSQSQSMPPPPLPPSISSSSSTSVSSSTSQQQQQQPLISNSLAIRQEIQRFESVHPSIYAIYDLIDLLPTADAQIAQQIRDHVVCIEDSFVNSQEWTISRAVPDLRLGIVGSLNSGKSALVHRYLTGSYMQEESPEGGRFKKEVFIDGQSYLLLVRDEGGAPEMQFAAWVDAVIFVFSLENESSFNTVYNFYTKLAHFRNGQDLPIILVGTQDAINENNPRVIDDARARKLANELKRCAYYETCATYGLNVERVFQDACQKILQQRVPMAPAIPSRPTTPQGARLSITSYSYNSANINRNSSNNNISNTNGGQANSSSCQPPAYRQNVHSTSSLYMPPPVSTATAVSGSATGRTINDFIHNELTNNNNNNNNNNQKMWAQPQHQTKLQQQQQQLLQRRELFPLMNNDNNNMTKYKTGQQQQHPQQQNDGEKQQQLLLSVSGTQQKHGCHVMDNNTTSYSLVPLREAKENSILGLNSSAQKELPTPTSTPTTSRKSRRRSNLFIPSSSKKSEKEAKNNELGSGRSIPIKQGYLYKRSSKSLNKEWKKKYVTLCDDGRLTYHPSLHDYMDDVHGKEIPLQYVTVKVPGQKPRGSKSIITNSVLTTSLFTNAFETLRDPVKSNSSQQTSGDDEGIALSNSNSQTFITTDNQQQQQQQLNIKKRHRRVKSSGVKSNEIDDSDGYEFFIVSLDSKQWHFEAANSEERDGWVAAIEQEIFKSLQGIESTKMKPATTSELAAMVAIRTRVPGNTHCVDCDAPNPEWASLNLGVLLCIECSGIHRNLGSHISKVRSLGLDDWPPGHLSVLLAIGNKLANSVWEGNKGSRTKPQPQSSRDEKEAWARSKYDTKEFLALPQNGNNNGTTTIAPATGQQLIEAVIKSDMKSIVSILATVNSDVVNSTVSTRDVRSPLLLACAMGNLAIAQLLLWNGANIKHIDHEGRTCLSYARAALSLATAKSLRATETANSGNSSSSTNSSISSAASVLPQTQYSVEETTALVELLTSLGCPESAPLTASGTLPRRRDTLGTAYEKLMSGVI